VGAAGAVEVPAAARLLERVAVREGVGVPRAAVVELHLGEAVRLALDQEARAAEEAGGEVGEPRSQVVPLKTCGPLEQGRPVTHGPILRQEVDGVEELSALAPIPSNWR